MAPTQINRKGKSARLSFGDVATLLGKTHIDSVVDGDEVLAKFAGLVEHLEVVLVLWTGQGAG